MDDNKVKSTKERINQLLHSALDELMMDVEEGYRCSPSVLRKRIAVAFAAGYYAFKLEGAKTEGDFELITLATMFGEDASESFLRSITKDKVKPSENQ